MVPGHVWGRTCVGGDLNPVALNPGGRSNPQHLHRVLIQDPEPQVGGRSHCRGRKPRGAVNATSPACSCSVLSVDCYTTQDKNDNNNNTLRERERVI